MQTLTRSNLDIGIVDKAGTVLVDKHCTVSNNGRVLYKVTRPSIDRDTFPNIGGFIPQQEESFVMTSEQALSVSKAIPKAKKAMDVLKQAVVSQNGKVEVATTDLNNNSIVRVETTGETYPRYQGVIPESKDCNIKIGINPALLEQACKLAKEFQQQRDNDQDIGALMTMEFSYSKNNIPGAIKLSARNVATRQNFTAVVMPMNMEGNEEKNARTNNC